MAELIWNINGKYFKDFGVFVSDSKGIMDEPNQKKADTYDWAEYHGLATNLQSKPKYEAREFELSCWVKGGDWLEMRNNFDAIMVEFRKAGKQRLTLDIFGEKNYVWDVNINGKVELKKTLQKGIQVGVFTIKLIEYNPIKKILTTTNSNLQLSFNSPKWVEVNIDGNIESLKGSVSIDKPLTVRKLSNYNYGGRNTFKSNTLISAEPGVTVDQRTNKSFHILGSPDRITKEVRISGVITENGDWTISFDAWGADAINPLTIDFCDGNLFYVNITDVKKRYSFTYNVQNANSVYNFIDFSVIYAHYFFDNIKIEKGNKATDWTPAPEDVHFISIAGNVEEITNLTTNANVLWERL